MRILAIDPGNKQSAYVLVDQAYRPVQFGKIKNTDMRAAIQNFKSDDEIKYIIEMVASYGMAVGKTVFDTCVWIGRFTELIGQVEYIYRKDIKLNICGQTRAKDSNVRQALVDRFAQHDLKMGKGTKANPDWFYGFKSDIWAAYTVGVTYLDNTGLGVW